MLSVFSLFNDYPLFKVYALSTYFLLKCLLLNDSVIVLTVLTEGVVLDAPSVALSSSPPQEQPWKREALLTASVSD